MLANINSHSVPKRSKLLLLLLQQKYFSIYWQTAMPRRNKPKHQEIHLHTIRLQHRFYRWFTTHHKFCKHGSNYA